ncbi:MAG: hypothetical protein K8L97_11730 [Anaerolineae bacterium]|nr:hypothetical protein [Anaerolineae bacterium]
MTDKVPLIIDVTPEEQARIERLAHERGFNALTSYLLALVESDAQALEGEPTQAEILENFRQGWKEAMNGEVLPIDTLWDGIEDE